MLLLLLLPLLPLLPPLPLADSSWRGVKGFAEGGTLRILLLVLLKPLASSCFSNTPWCDFLGGLVRLQLPGS